MKKGLFLLLMAFTLSLFIGCDDEERSIIVLMKNNSSEEVHLWCSGEDIAPTNKVVPGGSRSNTVFYKTDQAAQTYNISVSAGKNGSTLTSKSFEIKVTDGILSVSYSGGALSLVK